jgi:molybdopterin molybdotransferase
MISLEEAFRRLDAACENVTRPSERLPLERAHGRILAADVASGIDLPPFDRSAVDGYALPAGEEQAEYSVVETVTAGRPGRTQLAPGEAVKVMTGAPVPPGTARVAKVEHSHEKDGRVRIDRYPAQSNVCRRAEDLRAGQVILERGQALGALEIATLIGCAVGEVEVYVPPGIFVISTGDEIVDRPEDLSPGKIINSNGPLLRGLAEEHRLIVKGQVSVGDDLEKIETELGQAIRSADLVLLSGGVSVGDCDYVPEVMKRLGLTIHFNRVAVQPGKPTTFAARESKLVFGLPGNPVAVYVMFHLMVLRAVARLSHQPSLPAQIEVTMARTYERRSTARLAFVPARFTTEGSAETVVYHGSGHLTALVHADGFLVVPQGIAKIEAGEKVRFLPKR